MLDAGFVPLEMVKLCDSDVKKSVMLWKWVDESGRVDAGHGNWPLPDTSIATCRLSKKLVRS